MLHEDLNYIVLEVARSGLDLEVLDISSNNSIPAAETLRELGTNMKSLKILKCGNLHLLRDSDLVLIAETLPGLEELDISYADDSFASMWNSDLSDMDQLGVTDFGIQALTCKLKELRKINISGLQYLDDESLFALSSNCASLREVQILDCFFSQHGVGFLMRHSPSLNSLSIHSRNILFYTPSPSSFTIENSIIHARALSNLELYSMDVSDKLLHLIAEAHLPLKKFVLSYCQNFTLLGILTFLHACQSLEHLGFCGVGILTDQAIKDDLCQGFKNLTSISLSACSKLTNLTFFLLARECPRLFELDMSYTRLGVGEVSITELRKNFRMELLRLRCNRRLDDETLRKINLVCPSTRLLHVEYCDRLTEEGVREFLEGCPHMAHLKVDAGMRNFLEKFKKCGIEIEYSFGKYGIPFNDDD